MHHVMFDIDGTLVKSYDLDSRCYIDSIMEVTGVRVDSDWSKYRHVTDSGILEEIIKVNGLSNRQELQEKVKTVFMVQEIPGAGSFLKLLNSMSDITVSLATGGWHESAVLKLSSAGIDCSSLPLASSNDNMSRTEIMKVAVSRAAKAKNCPCTYFGDGIWDKRACKELGFNFVLVGNKFEHMPNIIDFMSVDTAITCIGI